MPFGARTVRLHFRATEKTAPSLLVSQYELSTTGKIGFVPSARRQGHREAGSERDNVPQTCEVSEDAWSIPQERFGHRVGEQLDFLPLMFKGMNVVEFLTLTRFSESIVSRAGTNLQTHRSSSCACACAGKRRGSSHQSGPAWFFSCAVWV